MSETVRRLAEECQRLNAENVRLGRALKAALDRMESDVDALESEFGQSRSILDIEKDGDLPREILEARALLAELEAHND